MENNEHDKDMIRMVKQRSDRPNYARILSMEMVKDGQIEQKMEGEETIQQMIRDEESILSERGAALGCMDESQPQASDINYSTDHVHSKLGSKKKQKKQRKQKAKLEMLEHMGGIMEGMNQDILEPSLELGDNVTVMRLVPSLIQLCMSADWKARTGHVSKSSMPPGMREMIEQKKHNSEMITMLMESTLSVLSNSNTFYSAHDSGAPEVYDSSFFETTSGLWINFPQAMWSDLGEPKSNVHGAEILPYYFFESDGYDTPIDVQLVSAYVSLLDLMLAAVISKTPAESHAFDNDKIFVKRAKKNIHLRSEHERECRELEMIGEPYMWWSRGNMAMARESMLALAHSRKAERMRAANLNEVGRLHIHFGDIEGAIHYYKMASEEIHQFSRSFDRLSAQTLILCAFAYSTGVLDHTKAMHSVHQWKCVLGSKLAPEVAALYAVESALCWHCGWSTDPSQEYLPEMVKLIKSIAVTYPRAYSHLAAIYAMMGDADSARLALTDVLKTSDTKASLGLTENYWDDVIKNLSSDHIAPMKVIWRSQLAHPFLQTETTFYLTFYNYNLYADLVPNHANLRLTKDGYITGDMKMLIPPMKAIYLDPYTGSLVFLKEPLPREDFSYNLSHPFSPHKLLLLERKDGAAVHLITTIKWDKICDERVWDKVDILLHETDGSMHHCNVRSLIYQKYYQDVRKQILNIEPECLLNDVAIRRECFNSISNKTAIVTELFRMTDEYRYSPQWKREALKLQNEFYSKGQGYSLKKIDALLYMRKYKKFKEALLNDPRWQKQQKDAIEDPLVWKKADENFSPMLVSFKVYSNTVALFFSATQADDIADILMIINCENASKFENPVVFTCIEVGQRWNTKDWSIPEVREENGIGVRQTNAHIIAVDYYQRKKGHRLMVYDLDGNIVNGKNDNFSQSTSDFNMLTKVIGSHLYGVNAVGNRVICEDLIERRESRMFPNILALEQYGNHLLVSTEAGLYVLDRHMTPAVFKLGAFKDKLYLEDDNQCLSTKSADDMRQIKLLDLRMSPSMNQDYSGVLIGLMGHVMDLELPNDSQQEVIVQLHLVVPGEAVEGCVISRQDGILVSSTPNTQGIIDENIQLSPHHLFHIGPDGRIKSMMPAMAAGERSFLVMRLPPKHGSPMKETCLSVAFFDGYGAITCVQI